jgi:hypothetical protein
MMMGIGSAVSLSLAAVLIRGIVPASAQSQIVINEVYYDHPGPDSGWEFVELFNPGPAAVELDGYLLEFVDGLSGGVRTIWESAGNGFIAPGGIVLVAGENMSPGEGFELIGSIENGPDAVRLVSSDGAQDILGYGDCAFHEGEPAEDVPGGMSLSRRPDGRDTDSNAADFVGAAPTPGRRNFYDIDLGLEIADRSILPCAGNPFPLSVSVENRGMQPFEGTLGVSGYSEGDLGTDRRIIGPVALDPGSAITAELSLHAAPSGAFVTRASVDAPGDQNRSNDTVTVTVSVSPACVVVNEIMYRPGEGGSEWIELYCRSTDVCSLVGWSVCDAAGVERSISGSDPAVQPGGFCIIAQDTALFIRDHPSCGAAVFGLEGGWTWLNDRDSDGRADVVELRDGRGVLIERIEYRDLLGDERGRSIERFDSDVCSRYPGGLWHRCLAWSGSTPGEVNSTASPSKSSLPALRADPNPFSPADHGAVVISGRTADGESGFVVRIFEIDGKEVARLFAEEGGAKIWSCRWDGRDRAGEPVATGLYICVAEYVRMGGGVCRREKLGLAVYGGGRCRQ